MRRLSLKFEKEEQKRVFSRDSNEPLVRGAATRHLACATGRTALLRAGAPSRKASSAQGEQSRGEAGAKSPCMHARKEKVRLIPREVESRSSAKEKACMRLRTAPGTKGRSAMGVGWGRDWLCGGIKCYYRRTESIGKSASATQGKSPRAVPEKGRPQSSYRQNPHKSTCCIRLLKEGLMVLSQRHGAREAEREREAGKEGEMALPRWRSGALDLHLSLSLSLSSLPLSHTLPVADSIKYCQSKKCDSQSAYRRSSAAPWRQAARRRTDGAWWEADRISLGIDGMD